MAEGDMAKRGEKQASVLANMCVLQGKYWDELKTTSDANEADRNNLSTWLRKQKKKKT